MAKHDPYESCNYHDILIESIKENPYLPTKHVKDSQPFEEERKLSYTSVPIILFYPSNIKIESPIGSLPIHLK